MFWNKREVEFGVASTGIAHTCVVALSSDERDGHEKRRDRN